MEKEEHQDEIREGEDAGNFDQLDLSLVLEEPHQYLLKEDKELVNELENKQNDSIIDECIKEIALIDYKDDDNKRHDSENLKTKTSKDTNSNADDLNRSTESKPDNKDTAADICKDPKVEIEDSAVKKDDNKSEDCVELDSLVPDLESSIEEDDTSITTPEDTSITPPKVFTKPGRASYGHEVWVLNINPATSATRLRLLLSKYGRVQSAKILKNGDDHYGFAVMDQEIAAKKCVERLNGFNLHGRIIKLSLHKPSVNANAIRKKKSMRANITSRRNPDPLTLRVIPRECISEDTYSQLMAKKRKQAEETRLYREELVRVKQQREEEQQLKRLQRQENLRIKRQRELRIKIEMDKKKIEHERRILEKEKADFVRKQRKVEEENRAKEIREKREKDAESKRLKATKLGSSNAIDRNRKRKSLSPDNASASTSWSPKRDKSLYRERIAAPPPPRITNDAPRAKKVDYFKGKENFSPNFNSNGYDKRYRDERNFNNKYSMKNDDKYKEKKPIYDCTSIPVIRSEAYHPTDHRSFPLPPEPPRRFMLSYPPQYGRYTEFPVPIQNAWGRPNIPKEYQQNMPPKNFHQEHPRYDERHQHFAPRKY